MSWSEGRDSDNKIDPEKFKTERAEALKLLNGNLKFLAENSDFHEDLKLPVVQAAFMHWTGSYKPVSYMKTQENPKFMIIIPDIGNSFSRYNFSYTF
jgi:hypothetical protein